MRAFFNTILLMAALIAVPIVASSCKNPQQTAAKITMATVSTVDTGMQAYADAVVRGKVSLDTQNKIHSAYDRYFDSVQVAKDVVKSFATDHNTNAVLAASAAVKAASSDLLVLIQQFKK